MVNELLIREENIEFVGARSFFNEEIRVKLKKVYFLSCALFDV